MPFPVAQSRLTVASQFSTAFFNGFAEVEAADERRLALLSESEFVPFFGDSIRSADLDKSLGLMLVHRHWSVELCEIPVRHDLHVDGEGEIIVRPEPNPVRQCEPIAWAFERRASGDVVLAPTEFSATPRGLDAGFFERLALVASRSFAFLEERGADDLFGFALRNRQELAADEVWSEESYASRISVMRPAKAADSSSSITTFWQFQRDAGETDCRPEWVCNPAGEAHHRVLRHVK
jgi:hypothetical protein